MSLKAQSLDDTTVATLRHFVNQRVTRVALPSEWTVDRATRELADALELPPTGGGGGAAVGRSYELFRKRDGASERLSPSARVREVVREGDELEPVPEVVPG